MASMYRKCLAEHLIRLVFFDGCKQQTSGYAGSELSVYVYMYSIFVCESVHLWVSVCVCLGVLIRCGLIKSVLEKEEQTGVIEKHKGTRSD